MNGEEKGGDATHSVPSETIIEVMEKYFNKELFKKKVRVLELQARGDVYMFSLEYIQQQKQQVYDVYVGGGTGINGEVLTPVKIAEDVTIPGINDNTPRAKNGRFAKKDTE